MEVSLPTSPTLPSPSGARARGRWARSLAVVLAALALCLAPGAARAAPGQGERAAPSSATVEKQVVHVRIEGALDVGTQSLLRRGIERARETSRVLVVEIDTPGGEIELMFALAQLLDNAHDNDGVMTVAWVNDRAYSAGSLVALTCEKLYMRAQGAIGAAGIIEVSPEGGVQDLQNPTVAAKQFSAVRAIFRAYAQANGRPVALAEAMVDRSLGAKQVRLPSGELRIVSNAELDELQSAGDVEVVRTIAQEGNLVALSGTEAVQYGFADGVAEKLDDVLALVGYSGAQVVPIARARSEDLATWLSTARILLIGIGVMALVAEFKAPGFGFAGAVAIACFGLALFGNYLVGVADVPHLVAVGLGLALIAVELFLMPGAIWPGSVGAVLVLGGLAFAQFGPGFFSSALGRELAVDSALELGFGILVALCLGAVLARLLPHTPLVGRMVQGPTPAFAGGAPASEFVRAPVVGERGLSTTPLRPVGKVRLGSRTDEVEARSSGVAIEAGVEVQVIAVEGLRAVVEPAGGARA